MAGSSAPVMYGAVRITLCSIMRSSAVLLTKPSNELASRDALNCTAVDIFEDLRAHAKPFQPPEGEELLSRLLHDYVHVCGPLKVLSDLDTEELEALDPLPCSSVDVDVGVARPSVSCSPRSAPWSY